MISKDFACMGAKVFALGLSVLLCLGGLLGRAAAASNQKEILRKADEARGNLKGVKWKVTVTSSGAKGADSMDFDVKARGFDFLAESLAPPKDKGSKILMLSGTMWFHKPGLSKPVPISQRQRLLGNAAYADIAATNYASDYEGTLLEDERVNGELCYVLDLRSKASKNAYDRIKYWVSKERFVGVKAEYFTVSGKKFKSAMMEYANAVKIDGASRPFISLIRIYDELLSEQVTTLSLSSASFQELPPYIFNLNLLRK